MVVSATKSEEDALDVAAPVSVVSGDELRRHGAKTVAEALQDVAGLDTGNGSDNGSRLANIGVWGLKEFDALLVTVDGVPAGGPFNPSLAQISVEDVERIEIVKGPQGTLYGVSAFAGMIQVFTRHPKEAGGALTLGGGSFSDKHGNLSYTASQGDQTIRLFGSMVRNKGWQDGTDVSADRLSLGYMKRTKEGSVNVTLGVTPRHELLRVAASGRRRPARARFRGRPELRDRRRPARPPHLLPRLHGVPAALGLRPPREHARPDA